MSTMLSAATSATTTVLWGIALVLIACLVYYVFFRTRGRNIEIKANVEVDTDSAEPESGGTETGRSADRLTGEDIRQPVGTPPASPPSPPPPPQAIPLLALPQMPKTKVRGQAVNKADLGRVDPSQVESMTALGFTLLPVTGNVVTWVRYGLTLSFYDTYPCSLKEALDQIVGVLRDEARRDLVYKLLSLTDETVAPIAPTTREESRGEDRAESPAEPGPEIVSAAEPGPVVGRSWRSRGVTGSVSRSVVVGRDCRGQVADATYTEGKRIVLAKFAGNTAITFPFSELSSCISAAGMNQRTSGKIIGMLVFEKVLRGTYRKMRLYGNGPDTAE